MRKYSSQTKQMVAFDSRIGNIYDSCVGSHRYEVVVETAGGHSFQEFGKENALAEMSRIVSKIYDIEVVSDGTSRTTYNVGIIEGGTSVNTIAQRAKMLCEYRSDNATFLKIMQNKFSAIFENAKKDGVKVFVKLIGERPCEVGVNKAHKEELAGVCLDVAHNITGKEIILKSASTDCNIPLSMGIPAVCTGVFSGQGAHTREE